MRDGFGREIDYLRASLTDLCNLRCIYCMNGGGVEKKAHSDILTLEDVFSVISAFVDTGGKKVRFTGGEPLVRRNAISLIERTGKLGLERLGITTNGIYLPEYAERLCDAGVNAVNISIDSIEPDKYRRITVTGELEDALKGLDVAVKTFKNVKINAVLMRGVNDDIRLFAEFAAERGAMLRYIELMPFACNDSYKHYGVSAVEVIEKYGLRPIECVGNTDVYAFEDGLRVGFILRRMQPLAPDFGRKTAVLPAWQR